MSMTEIIDGMTHEMVGSDSFEQFMNRPLPHNGQAYIQRDYKTGKDYICCPFCGKKNFPLTPGAHITGPVSYTHLDVYKRQVLNSDRYQAIQI